VVPAYRNADNNLDYYEESDRGPDFVRCALKSCELFKILHLSLPDNMIGQREMLDIAKVIQKNTPLMTLNLSNNVVDANAAVILAQALSLNSHLKEIDLRNNKLKDAGIAILLEPFVLQKLQQKGLRISLATSPQKVMDSSKSMQTLLRTSTHRFVPLSVKKYKMRLRKLISTRC
jgi:Ran GTPase-activating protein (RanGAP) involved in mRNA processing and transport